MKHPEVVLQVSSSVGADVAYVFHVFQTQHDNNEIILEICKMYFIHYSNFWP